MAEIRRNASPAWSSADLRGNPHEAADKADRVRRMFAAIAPRYDLNNRLHSFGRDQVWRRRVIERSSVGPDDDVLDAACGTGDLAIAFARAGARSVTGIDFTDEMLEIARDKAQGALGDATRATTRFVNGDVTNLPFANESFDIISIAFGLRNVTATARALSEFRRVLRPGGRLLILEFGSPDNRIIRALNSIYTNHIMPWTATLISRDGSGAYRYLPRSIETYLEPEAMVAAMRDAGFSRIQQTPLTFGVCRIFSGHVE